MQIIKYCQESMRMWFSVDLRSKFKYHVCENLLLVSCCVSRKAEAVSYSAVVCRDTQCI